MQVGCLMGMSILLFRSDETEDRKHDAGFLHCLCCSLPLPVCLRLRLRRREAVDMYACHLVSRIFF